MEEINLVRRDVPGSSRKFTDIKETFGSEKAKYGCYEKCMNDPWDMEAESVCASACGL